MAPVTDAIVGSLPAAKQGVASAVDGVARQLGAAFGIAIMGSVFNAGYGNDIGPALAALPTRSRRGCQGRSGRRARPRRPSRPHRRPVSPRPATPSWSGGRSAMLAGAPLLLVGAAVAWRAPRRNEDPEVHSELEVLDDNGGGRAADGCRRRFTSAVADAAPTSPQKSATCATARPRDSSSPSAPIGGSGGILDG